MSPHPTHEFALLLHRGDAAALDEAVARFASQMEVEGEADLLHYWKGRTQLLRGDAATAVATSGNIADPQIAQSLKILALREQAKATKDASALIAFLDERSAADGDAISLYESCEAHLRLGQVANAAARAEELARRVPTPAGLDVAIQSLMAAGDLAGALRVSENAGRLFPNGELPIEYRRLRVRCEQQLGRVARILPEAERLATESGQPEDVTQLVRLQLKAADPKMAAVAARRLLRIGEVRAEDLIPTARAIFSEDRRLSRQLLQRAAAKDLRVELLPEAINLAGELGENEILGRLFPTMMEKAAAAGTPIRAIDPAAFEEMRRVQMQRLAHAGQLYEQGGVPLHGITGEFGGSMPAFFDAAFHPPMIEPGKWPARATVFIRHGARATDYEPSPFSRVHLDISGLLIAEELGILDSLERVFAPLYLPVAATGILLAQIQHAELLQTPRSAALRDKMNDLLARIREGLHNERWAYLPDPQVTAGDDSDEMESACLYALIQAPPLTGAVAWLDDRLLNSHGRCGATVIVTVVGILRELHRRGELDSAKMFTALHQLRAAEMRYVPLATEEILHWLSNAEIANRQIVETTELATLRRYAALCLSDRGKLQGAANRSPNNHPAGEAPFVLSLYRAITETLPEIWRGDESVEVRVARADWVLHELWFDPGAGAQALGVALPSSAALKIAGSGFSHLYSLGIALGLPSLNTRDETPTALKAFMAWLHRRTAQDEVSLENAAHWLSDVLAPNRYEKNRDATYRRFLSQMLRNAYFALPEDVRRRVKLSKRQRRDLGIGRIDLLTFGGHSFEARAYWRAAAAVLAGKSAMVKSHGTEREFALQAVEEKDILGLRHVSTDESQTFGSADPIFLALHGNAAQREAGLLRFPGWFEASGKPLARITRHLARIGNVPQRMDAILAERKRSADYLYQEFGHALENGHTPHLHEFVPPPVASLVRHLRLPWPAPSRLSAEDYETAATLLVQDVGLEEALRRFFALPIRLPEALQAAVQALGATEQAELIERLREEATTPTAQLHVMEILLADEMFGTHGAAAIFENLASEPSNDHFAGFDAVLRWVCQCFAEADQSESVPAAATLIAAWVHGTRLHSFLAPISRKGHMAKFFTDATRFLPGESFRRREELIGDIAHPRSLHRSRLLLLGLASALPESRELPDVLRQHACNLAFYSEEKVRAPRIELLQTFRDCSNHLGSYLGADCGTTFARLLPPEDAAYFVAAELDQAVADALCGLHEAPAAANHWLTLATLLRRSPVPVEKLGDDFEKALLACKLRDFLEAEPDATRVILFFQASQAVAEPIRTHVRSGLIELAQIFAKETESKRSLVQRAELLLESSHQWATAFDDEKTAARDMSEVVTEFVVLWPEVAAEAWRILRIVLFRLPPAQIAEFWPMISKLRAETWRLVQRSDAASGK